MKLNVKCGSVLHRGTVASLFSQDRKFDTAFTEIRAWKQKIEVLLDYHAIFMLDKKTIVLFVLRNMENQGRVQVAVCEAEDLSTLLSEASNKK
jgi:hypothetical protein